MFEAMQTGAFRVDVATSDGGHPVEFWASRATDKILSVADTAPPVIRDQAVAFKGRMEAVILHYIKEAIKDNNSVISKTLADAGHPQLADLVRRL